METKLNPLDLDSFDAGQEMINRELQQVFSEKKISKEKEDCQYYQNSRPVV